jgi:hypothetical protein
VPGSVAVNEIFLWVTVCTSLLYVLEMADIWDPCDYLLILLAALVTACIGQCVSDEVINMSVGTTACAQQCNNGSHQSLWVI